MTLDDDPQPATQEIADIIKANEQFYYAIENADMDLMREVWAAAPYEESVTCVHPGQSAVHGIKRVLRSWAVVCSRINYLQFIITDLRVLQLGDVAVVTCVENVLSELPGQDSTGLAGSHYEAVNVFHRLGEADGGPWRLVTHSSAPVFPAADHAEG